MSLYTRLIYHNSIARQAEIGTKNNIHMNVFWTPINRNSRYAEMLTKNVHMNMFNHNSSQAEM